MPDDGDSRFDWRTQAPSKMQKASGGDRWFPQLAVERRPSPKIKLTDGDLFHDELTRYKNQ